MNEFMRGNYAAAVERARIAATGAIRKVPVYPLLLAASLVDDGRRDEARQVVDELKQRHPGLRRRTRDRRLVGDERRSALRRRRAADRRTARELGLP